MDYQAITLEKADGIVTLTLNRPDVLNALNDQMTAEITQAFEAIEQDDEVRVLVITGAGRAFSAGADMSSFKRTMEQVRQGEAASVM